MTGDNGLDGLVDGRLSWVGDFDGDGQSEILFWYRADQNWWSSRLDSTGGLQWTPAGNTTGFGNLADGRPFWVGDFKGDGRTEILFWYPGDGNWWLGETDPTGVLQWTLAGNTTGLGNLADGRPFWVGDFTADGHSDLLFLSPDDGNWWLGQFDGAGALTWSLVTDSSNFGDLADGRPLMVGDVLGDGHTDVVFYSPGDGNWWRARFVGTDPAALSLQWTLAVTDAFGALPGALFWVDDFTTSGKADIVFSFPGDESWWRGQFGPDGSLAWKQVGDTANFGQLADGRPIWVADFNGDGQCEILFYSPADGNWWLGEIRDDALVWTLVGNTSGFGNIADGRPIWVGAFAGRSTTELLFFSPGDGNSWRGLLDATTPTPSLVWELAMTFRATADSRMSDDVLLVQDLSLDPNASAPVSVVALPTGQVGLFAILADHGAVSLQPSPTSASGTTPSALPDGIGATEIVSLVDPGDVLHVLYAASAGVSHVWSFDGGASWTGPDALASASGLAVAQAVAGAPTTVYGVSSDGNLVLYQGGAGPWAASTVDLGGALMSADGPALLQYTTTGTWYLAAVSDATMHVWSGSGAAVGESWDPCPATAVLFGDATGDTATFVVADQHLSIVTVMAGDGGHQTTTSTDSASSPPPFAQSVGNVDAQGLFCCYGVDPNGTLCVVRQVEQNGSWLPALPIQPDVQYVAPPAGGGGGITLGLVRADGTFVLLVQSSEDAGWTSVPMQGDSTVPMHVDRYRTELTLVDATGAPMADTVVRVTPSSVVALEVDGATVFAAPNAPAVLTSGPLGTITFSQPALALDAVRFTVTGDGIASPVSVAPYDYLHANLAGGLDTAIFTGSGTVPPLTADTLRAATVNGTPLAPGLDERMAQVVTSTIGQALLLTAGGAPGIAGYEMDIRNPSQPSFIVHVSQADVQSSLAAMRQSITAGLLHDLVHDAHDIWHAIRTGAVKVVQWVVDTEHKVVSALVRIGDDIDSALQDLVMDAETDISKVVSFIHNVLSSIKVAIGDVIDWLKDLFAWDDMWNTMLALKTYLTDGLASASTWAGNAALKTQEFFGDLQRKVDENLGSTGSTLGDRTLGPKPSTSQPGSSAQSGWMHSKAIAHVPSSHYTDVIQSDFSSLFDQLETAIEQSGMVADTSAAFSKLKQFFTDLVDTRNDLGHVLLTDLLAALGDMIDAVLAGMSAIATMVLDLVQDAIKGILTDLTTPLPDIPLISWLWTEIRPKGSDEPCSLVGLACLVCAVPTTLVYKLTHDNRAPFAAPAPSSSNALTTTSSTPVADNLDDFNFQFSFALMVFDIANDLCTAKSNWEPGESSDASPAVGSLTQAVPLFINWMDCIVNGVSALMFLAAEIASDAEQSRPTSFAQKWNDAVLGAYMAPVVADLVFAGIESAYSRRGEEPPPTLWTVQANIDMILGVLLIGTGMVGATLGVLDKPPTSTAVDVAEAIVGPLPWATQFLLSTEALNSTDPVPGVTAALQVVVDVIGDFDASDIP